VSSRSYLSIGDVLTLLRQEFPDVTISKIRFLESQGLVNPERTPSGYRKFYEHDVERLRWVLRQQREHFLPLKVIKDRLDDEGADAGSAASPTPPEVPATTAAVAPDPAEEAVLVGQRSVAEGTAPRAGDPIQRHTADTSATALRGSSGGPTLPGIEATHAATNGGPVGATAARDAAASSKAAAARRHPAPEPAAAAGPAPEAVGPARRTAKAGTAPDEAAAAAPATRRPRPTPATAAQAGLAHSHATPTEPTAAGPTPAGEAPTHTTAAAAPPVGPAVGEDPVVASGPPAVTGRAKGARAAAPVVPADAGVAPSAGATMSLEELATASGLDVATLEELASYGLLAGTKVAGQVFYDDECLAVARLAAGFARFGVEPRHLRLYKNAADREAGFVEQIVIPLVRQRNPEARVRAHQTVDELTHLGQQLRASLVRSALGNLLDG
jgi:DNA-binding transcriptional MerR regulator